MWKAEDINMQTRILFSKLNIRHNNLEDERTEEFVKNMSEELELWYDYISDDITCFS